MLAHNSVWVLQDLNSAYLAGSTVHGLDTDTVLRVGDSATGDVDTVDGVIASAADGANADTVATRALGAREVDVSTRVDSKAVILVLDGGVGDVNTVRGADVESVGVVATTAVTSRVVNGDGVESKLRGTVDGKGLDGSVLDVEAGDGRRLHAVGVEELGLGLSTVRALAIPPLLTGTVDNMAGGTSDLKVAARHADEGTRPLLVAKGGGTLELLAS
jgi:hypothetical protein